MEDNLFAPTREEAPAQRGQKDRQPVAVPDYSISPSGPLDHLLAFFIGFAAGFAVLFIFYKILPLSVAGGALVGIVYVFAAAQNAIHKRLTKLRVEFYDLLEAMSVAMRAGNPVLKALLSAQGDLSMIYPEDSDIMVELNLILSRFNNAVPLSEAFLDFARRSGLEDVESFASVYATIEGKSGRADEIIRETQQIIADKMEIEMEIDTMMTAAKSEVNIMLFMPLVILLVIGYAGAGFMDALYTTPLGRLVATVGLVVFIVSFIMARKFSNIEL
ncbi:type II secretion system F family protein [Clostridium sp. D33t1_170424_F3]|uniref:type II secretion system F family protein n=1 Tax=Clostridium sp. D33t1_170424_F3 TaxID=2787099 RepID=UPI0018AB3069|nr:type II secretion system F family protein [Clostridium sp. D33t1_170424_F3]